MIKNVAILLNAYHNAGPSNVMRGIIRHIDKRYARITLVTLLHKNSPSDIQELKEMGVEIIEFNFKDKREAMLKGPHALKQIVEQLQIDVLHSNSVITDLTSVLSKCDVLRIRTLHNNIIDNCFEHHGKYIGTFMLQLHLWLLKKIDICVCCSKCIYDDLSAKLQNLTVVRNGVDYKSDCHAFFKESLNIPRNALVYIYTGKLIPRKNILWLANQFKNCHNRDEYLLILGNGPDAHEIGSINDDHIKLCGFIDTPQMYFNISDIYISASLSEGFSLSILEALSSGTLVVLSDIPSHREVFQLCENFYVGERFQNLDTSSLKNALNTIREKIKNTNRNTIKCVAQTTFSATIMADAYLKLYTNNLHIHKSRP